MHSAELTHIFKGHTHARARAHSVGRLRLQEALCTQLSPLQPVLISTIHLQIVMDRLLQLTHTHSHGNLNAHCST